MQLIQNRIANAANAEPHNAANQSHIENTANTNHQTNEANQKQKIKAQVIHQEQRKRFIEVELHGLRRFGNSRYRVPTRSHSITCKLMPLPNKSILIHNYY